MQQVDVLRATLDALDRLQIDYAIVGSYASGIWGEPRMTLDVDLVVLLNRTQVEPLQEAFGDEFYVSRAAMIEAVDRLSQFNVIHPTSGNKIDFMLLPAGPPTPPEIAHRVEVQILPDLLAYVAAPEDVISRSSAIIN